MKHIKKTKIETLFHFLLVPLLVTTTKIEPFFVAVFPVGMRFSLSVVDVVFVGRFVVVLGLTVVLGKSFVVYRMVVDGRRTSVVFGGAVSGISGSVILSMVIFMAEVSGNFSCPQYVPLKSSRSKDQIITPPSRCSIIHSVW